MEGLTLGSQKTCLLRRDFVPLKKGEMQVRARLGVRTWAGGWERGQGDVREQGWGVRGGGGPPGEGAVCL